MRKFGKSVVIYSIRYSEMRYVLGDYDQCWEHRACKTNVQTTHLMELMSLSGHVAYEEIVPILQLFQEGPYQT